MPERFFTVLEDVADGRIIRDQHYHYRRNGGLGRVCDTIIYTLEDRALILLIPDGTVSLTDTGMRILREKSWSGEFDPSSRPEEEVDADHCRGTELRG